MMILVSESPDSCLKMVILIHRHVTCAGCGSCRSCSVRRTLKDDDDVQVYAAWWNSGSQTVLYLTYTMYVTAADTGN